MPGSSKDTPTRWRREADSAHPAGPLFAEQALADIVCETGTTSGYCGTACSASRTRYCC
jgi:hypothetical protein